MSYMSKPDRLHLARHGADGLRALTAVEEVIAAGPLDPTLLHLVKLRVSQINACVFCVGMHIREALQDGDTQARLDHVVVWRDTNLFSPAERAALAWSEALTVPGNGADLDSLHASLQKHFSAEQICSLMLVVVMINTWNRVQIGAHGSRF